VKVPGDYIVTSSSYLSAGTSDLNIYINGALYSYLSTNSADVTSGVSIVPNLKAGDVISYRVSISATIAGSTASKFSITKLSGPSQVAASDSVSALYTGAPPTGTLAGSFNTTTYGTKVKDSHNRYSGGLYTVPSNGVYDVSASNSVAATYGLGNATAIAIAINGTPAYSSYTYTAGAVGTVDNKISVSSIPLLEGQTVSIQTYIDGGSPSFNASAPRNTFSITRTGNY
jgi:hypothetical protein